mgnify:CR=1 FL=1
MCKTDAGIHTGITLDKCKLTEKIDYFDWKTTCYEIYIISFKVYVRLLSQPSFHKRIIERQNACSQLYDPLKVFTNYCRQNCKVSTTIADKMELPRPLPPLPTEPGQSNISSRYCMKKCGCKMVSLSFEDRLWICKWTNDPCHFIDKAWVDCSKLTTPKN